MLLPVSSSAWVGPLPGGGSRPMGCGGLGQRVNPSHSCCSLLVPRAAMVQDVTLLPCYRQLPMQMCAILATTKLPVIMVELTCVPPLTLPACSRRRSLRRRRSCLTTLTVRTTATTARMSRQRRPRPPRPRRPRRHLPSRWVHATSKPHAQRAPHAACRHHPPARIPRAAGAPQPALDVLSLECQSA